MRLTYIVCFYLLVPFIFLRMLWRSIKAPQYRQRLQERYGFVPESFDHSKNAPLIWLHTVSVGETIAAQPVVNAILQNYPQHCLLMTTMTPTGSEQVKTLFAKSIADGRIIHCYIPYDLPDCVARFLSRVKPQLAIFMETEVWPTTLTICKRRNIPTLLINARLSERSLNGYHKFSWLTGNIFAQFSGVAAQSQDDADRIQQLSGAHSQVTGSLKSEITVDDKYKTQAVRLKKAWSADSTRKIVLAASTHRGEDEIILAAYKKLLHRYPDLLLLLVPRHPERFNTVNQLCLDQQFTVQRRSREAVVSADVQIILGDTMGELMLFYGVADITVVCGSFVDSGGHNVLEPAAWSLPIISGPSMYNFSNIIQDLQEQQGLLLVNNQGELFEKIDQLMTDTAYATTLGNNAKMYVEKNRGALAKTMDMIYQFMPLH